MLVPEWPNDRWSLDFAADQFIDGRRLRILVVVDDCTRECLALIADTSISGIRVARELDRLLDERAKDDRERQWHRSDVERHPAMGRRSQGCLALHRAGQAVQNAFAESFIGRLRDELLNETLFRSLAHTRAVLEACQRGATSQRDRQQSPDRADRSVSGIRPALTGTGWKKPSNLVRKRPSDRTALTA
jgi:putative transposase